jgi:hypothetical protein
MVLSCALLSVFPISSGLGSSIADYAEMEQARCVSVYVNAVSARFQIISEIATYGRWIAERYPVAINTTEDLDKLLQKRLPQPPNPVQFMAQFEVAVETIVSNQSQIHSRLDYLVSLIVI